MCLIKTVRRRLALGFFSMIIVISHLVRVLPRHFMVVTDGDLKVSTFSMSRSEDWNYLRPPFHIVQVGKPRSASTFQFELLRAIVTLKSPPDTKIHLKFVSKTAWSSNPFRANFDLTSNSTFLVKTHMADRTIEEACQNGSVAVFSSGWDLPYSLYKQTKVNAEICSECEVDKYRHLFGLKDAEIDLLKEHMRDYKILRQCCGLQMSKYEVLRLNGCNVSKYVDLPNYPHCDDHDVYSVELRFAKSLIPFAALNTDLNWATPGDCARLNAEVAKGKRFNGQPLTSCDL